jgi:uncharacterized protein (DUF1697 family)
MSLWFAFLRGINLGNRQVKMAALKTCLEAAGFSEIKTVAASGNVRMEADGAPETIRERMETAIETEFGFAVGVVLRDPHELTAMLDDQPFGSLDRKADLTRHVLMFAEDLPAGLSIDSRPGDTEILRIDPREIYIAAYRQPNGRYTENIEAVLKPLYGRIGTGNLDTMRNWNTIEKMLA